MILDLFKTGVYFAECKLDLEPIKEFCIQHSYNHTSRHLSNEGGYQSPDINLKEFNVLAPLYSKIHFEVNVFANGMGLNDQNIDNAWININGKGHTNVMHCHPGVALSGVFYVNVPEDGGNIVFECPGSDVKDFAWYGQLDYENWNHYNSMHWTLPAVNNTLYLFPSFLKHRVEPNNNQSLQRISISFNTK